MDSARRVALFGGTFDPVHEGHLSIARAARESLELDQVVFIPCRQSPHKEDHPLARDDQRIDMLSLALSHEPWALISEMEMHLPPPSYSWVTAEAMSEIYPGSRLFWIVGSDQWSVIQTWARPGYLADLVEFIVLSRGDEMQPQPGFRSHFLQEEHPASAGEIRSSARNSLPGQWLHPDVEAYIRRHRLYGCRS